MSDDPATHCRDPDSLRECFPECGIVAEEDGFAQPPAEGCTACFMADEAPWDGAPVVGISQALGYRFLRPSGDGRGWQPCAPSISDQVLWRDQNTLVLHRDDLAGLAGLLGPSGAQ